MSKLLRKPGADRGLIQDVTPANAGWGYVGFQDWQLRPGDTAGAETGNTEVILVLIEGKARVSGGGIDFGEIGDRMDVFEKTPPHCVYVPAGSSWSVTATTAVDLGVCAAPGKPGRPAQRLGPEGITLTQRGRDTNTRWINNVAMEARDVADSLLVTEVFTPAGNWSSYPPHRHDQDDYPSITYLEETYYFRINPRQGYGHQRIWTEDGTLDETMSVGDRDVTLVPRGHHPCGAPYGYEMYYLNVMAGPIRKWRFKNHPDHNWIYERDLS